MSILKFSVPSDAKIQNDINQQKNEFNFVGNGSFFQNLKETLYIRRLKFYKDNTERKVIYKKEGTDWIFGNIE
ncbi:hypothetical protein [Lutibacter sp.]|uniref:hypothetical protein n=1 Tax=Lutibacter sp. TaxID=1925666 RepID=UPI0025C1BC93|nr:hypothetical protein [Lutibacter sp.]MCF6180618.1 hypothetical protein [Lutibacter sp.]